MTVIPMTEVRLLANVPLSNDYEHQMTFGSVVDQTTYFLGKSSHTFTDFTYQREDVSIKVPKGYDQLYNCNYVMYKNKDFSGKWFYGFITKKEYVNPNTTRIYFEIDVFQTWQFEMNVKQSFVEREHARRWNADGSPVVNTVDENLDYGSEYEMVYMENYVPFNDVYFMVIVCKQRMDTNSDKITPSMNGIVQPLTYYVHPFKLDGSVPSITIDGQSQTLSKLSDVLSAIYKMTNSVNNVVSLYVTEHFGKASLSYTMSQIEPVTIQDETAGFTTLYVKDLKSYETTTKNFGSKYDGFSGVTESKLLMYPYTVTMITDMKGNSQEIKSEYIEGNNLVVNVRGSVGTSNKVSYSVANYLRNIGITEIGNGIINDSPNDVPIITELLSAYLQGNRNSLENQKDTILFNQIFGSLGNALTKNPLGVAHGVGSGYLQMEGLLAKQYDLKATPPQMAKMGSNTSFDYGNGIKGLYVIKKQITAGARKRLSDFFKMYGYKINEVKVPNMKTRQHFNFVKTIGANIVGNIPHDDLQKLKDMFNNGVTFWHGDYVGDYSLSNGER